MMPSPDLQSNGAWKPRAGGITGSRAKQNGILDEPRFEVYMRHWYPPDPNIAEIPGDWRAEKTWPPREHAQ